MVSLPKYDRLEATGRWMQTSDAPAQEVVVSFGRASIVLSDIKDSRFIAHWSLPAVVRLNPGKRPALYAPTEDTEERLEIDDDTLVEAIERVHHVIASRMPHPGRLRGILYVTLAVAVVGAAVFWLPSALISHAAGVAPAPTRHEIGQHILRDLVRKTGAPCGGEAGNDALRRLSARIPGVSGIAVLPKGINGVRWLPGGIVVMGQDMLNNYDTPEVAVGSVLAAKVYAQEHDPLRSLLDWAGIRAAFRLLTTGALDKDDLTGYDGVILEQSQPLPQIPPLLKEFESVGVSSTPYAYAVDPSGEKVLPLIEADPFKGAPAPAPLLEDGQWVALQDICTTE
ncbi:hypothetical protein [Thioclava sp. GXIMD4216]|uniref:Type VII secretion protein EccB n=1 Tax=Thioclava litoralis TaxID=3076557 RepID=A0ABZ1E154_9RHOB|nr:hypothetical protein RPE78_03710 [Thioclava sp. FTW29]